MTRRMLINALYPEECRIAVADDDQLLELEVERADHTQLKGNIYKANITRIEPSLQAAFLDIGSNRNGFLQINDIHPAYFSNWPPEDRPTPPGRPSIQDVLRAGTELVVQVVKDERAAKGATLTTNLSIPGRFLVLMIGNQRGGVSRKIVDESQRFKLRQALSKLKIPAGMGVIVRTAGINRSSLELQRDLDALLEIWYDVIKKSSDRGAPRVLYKESDLALRTIRDYLTPNVEEILIDDKDTFDRACHFINKAVPSAATRVQYFEKPQPLFSYYHLDKQIEETSETEVILPSGGSIVINSTEAVVAVDVNSGRSTGQADVEETAFNTNKEAAVAVARQLRLRDLGGLIVIDFIDMNDRRHKATVEKVLRDSVRTDKAKIEIGRISKFGLLEMSRQRLKSSLSSQSHTVCPHCSGRGRVKTPESAALEALRKIQSATFAGGVEEIKLRMAPAAALLLLNSKRQILTKFEEQSGTHIFIYADGRMKPEEYEMEVKAGKHDELATITSEGPISLPPRHQSSRDGRPDRRNDRRDRDSRRDNDRRSGDRRDRGPREPLPPREPRPEVAAAEGANREPNAEDQPPRQGGEGDQNRPRRNDRRSNRRGGRRRSNRYNRNRNGGEGVAGGENQGGDGGGEAPQVAKAIAHEPE